MPLRRKAAAAQSFKDFLDLQDGFTAATRGLKSRQSRGAGARADCSSGCADGVGGGWEHYPCLLLKFVGAVLETWWSKRTGGL